LPDVSVRNDYFGFECGITAGITTYFSTANIEAFFEWIDGAWRGGGLP
jgi:hypothetical protein